jgi:polysaccharide export outer membrane protein
LNQLTIVLGILGAQIVKADGTIDFPILGSLDTKEKTVEQFSNYIKQRMTKYVIKPVVVNVNTLNYKVTVLGQVNRPGTYTINDGNATLLSALGLAGDLTNYGIRDNVLVVRNQNGQITKTRIDLTKADYLNFQMKQNDVIYVSGNETVSKTSRLDPNAGIYISVASIVVTILALVFKK